MSAYPTAQEKVSAAILKTTGKAVASLDPESWYPTDLYREVMDLYATHSVNGLGAIVTLGKRVYPTIKKAGGIPPSVTTPLALLKFEAEGFLANHRGPGVVPRKFLSARDGEVVVQAPAPGYSDKLYEGVFLGILEMFDIKTSRVVNEGQSTFRITW